MPHVDGDPTKAAPDLGLRGIELLNKIIEVIEAHPEHWRQSLWASVRDITLPRGWNWKDGLPEAQISTCGTAMCVAGWAAHLCGAQMKFEWFGSREIRAYGVVSDGDLKFESIERFACRVLELSAECADDLFAGENTLNDIKRIRDELVADTWAPSEGDDDDDDNDDGDEEED